MPDKPFFSIVVPTYNRAGFITSCIGSVLKQSYTDFELIIVDDGSTDDTAGVVASFTDRRIRYYKIQNSERAAARNYGAFASIGKFITFLDSDDLLKPNHLSEAEKFIKQNPDVDIFSQGYDILRTDGSSIAWRALPDPVNDKLLEGNFLSCLGVFIKREVFMVHPFNEDRGLSGSEDYELWMRLAARFRFRASPVSSAFLVDHHSRSVIKINREKFMTRMHLLKKYLSADPMVRQRFGGQFHKLVSYTDLYASLHLAIDSFKKDSVKMLWESFIHYPKVVFNYRFWVVVKKMVVG